MKNYPCRIRVALQFLLLAFLGREMIQGQTQVSGTMSGTWTRSESPYLVTSDVTVPEGMTLTIEPGVTVQFRDADDDLRVDGALVAVGTASTPIIFTSDTAEKAPGQWGELIIRDSSDDASTHLEHCVVEYGGGFRSSQLSLENASPLLRNLTIRSSRSDGLGVAGGSPELSSIHFLNNAGACANFDVHAFPEISGSTASGNGTNALLRHGGTLTSSGTWVRDQIPYTIINDIIVAAEARLTIEPGTTVQFRDSDDDLRIEGTLIAKSTAGNQTTFTSDNSEKAPAQWGAIEIRGSSVGTEITHALIEYGGGFRSAQLMVTDSSPKFEEVHLRGSRSAGLSITGGSAEVKSSRFTNNGDYAVVVSTTSSPVFANLTASGNDGNSVGLSGGTISESVTWSLPGIPYTVINDITVAAGSTLTITPGSVVQFQNADDDLKIEGRLIARGVRGGVIRFTSSLVDKSPGQWGQVAIQAQEGQARSELSLCIFEYGGGFRSEILLVEDSHPLIESCTFQSGRARGLTLLNSNAEIKNNEFLGNNSYAAAIDLSSFPVVTGNEVSENGSDSIGVMGGTLAKNGLWNAANLPFTIINDVTVGASHELTVAPGSTVQFQDSDDDLVIEGNIVAVGTSATPIRFTSDAVEKAPGQWGSITVKEGTETSNTAFHFCHFDSGGGFRGEIMFLDQRSPEISHSSFSESRNRGLTLQGSRSLVHDCLFADNLGYAVGMDLASFPSWENNRAEGNDADSIAIFGGTQSITGTWNPSQIPYTIINDVTVAAETTLTVAPPNTIQFQDTDDDLRIEGTLIAQGTITSPLIFTSDAFEKGPGQWGAVLITGASTAPASRLRYCRFDSGGGFRSEMLFVDGRSPEVSHSSFSGSRNRGLTLNNSRATLRNNHFANNLGYALVRDSNSFPNNERNTANGNGSDSFGILGGSISTSGLWMFDSLPHTVINDVTVGESVTLTIQQGSTVQFQDADDDLHIDGSLRAEGIQSAPILFTSDAIDKAPGQWGSLTFRASSDAAASILSWAVLEAGGGFASGMVELIESAPPIENCEFRQSRTHGLYIDSANPSVQSSSFHDNQDYGIRTVGGASPVVRHSNFVDNQDGGITNSDTSVIVDAINNYWGAANGPLDTRDLDELGQLNPEGQGQAVSEYVRWQPFLNEPNAPEPEPLPALEISPTEIVFGEVTVGESASATIRLQNTGSVALTLSELTIDAPEFTTVFSIPQTIALDSSVELTVTFTPTAPTPTNGRLTLSVPALGESSQLIRLEGTGITAPVDPQDPPTSSSPTRITFDPNDELTPVWHPVDHRIAFATNRTPGDFNDLGMVNADGSNERLIATGPQTGFGLAPFGITWAGPTDFLVTTESVTFHEYLSFDTTREPFNRTVSDNDDEAFSRLLLINGGGGGELFNVSRDGSTALWRFSSQGGRGEMTIRTAPYPSLTGQSAREHGTIRIAESLPLDSPRFVQGAGLFTDGSQFVASIRSGEGYDLFLYPTGGNSEPIRLTQEGESLGQNHTAPTVSPDNRWVAFAHSHPGQASDLYLRNLENGETRNLTQTPRLSENFPSWSPDGTRLVYQRFDTTDSGALQPNEQPNWNLYVINIDAASAPPNNGGVPCEAVPEGQLAWWTGDNTPTSETGSDPITLENGADYGEGFIKQAFIFDGIGNRISTGLDAQPNALPTTTWEAWVHPIRVMHGSRQQILSTDDGGFDRSVLIEAGSSNFGVFTGTGVWYPTSVTVDEWQHIAVVFTPETILFYKNGEAFDYGRAASGQGTRFDLKIGYNPGFGEYFQGAIDDVAIYDHELTPSEIRAIAEAGTAGKCGSGDTPPVDPSAPRPQIQPSETSIVFAPTEIGTRATESLTLNNTGNALLIIDGIDSAPPFAGLLPNFPLEIAPGESAEVVAIFAPMTFGEFTGTLALSTNDPNFPIVTLSVTGTGTELVVPAPILTSLLPAQAFPGDEIVLTGTGFSEVPGENSISIGDLSLVPTSATGSEIRFFLPAEISVGAYPVSIVTDGRESNPLSLTVPPPVPGVRPELTLTRDLSGAISIRWTDPSNSFTLQTTSNLGDNDAWAEASPIVTSAPGSFTYQDATLEGHGFFRLVPRR